MRMVNARPVATMKRPAHRWVLAFILAAGGPAWADATDCGSVLTDTSRSLQARRVIALQCLESACRQEAEELKLQPDATARFMSMCTVDQFDLVSADAPAAGDASGGAIGSDDVCVSDRECGDLNVSLEATAAGMRSGGRPDSGHTFVRVQRINEVIER